MKTKTKSSTKSSTATAVKSAPKSSAKETSKSTSSKSTSKSASKSSPKISSKSTTKAPTKAASRPTSKATTKTASQTGSKSTGRNSDKLDTQERKQLRASDFGIPESREYPMPDAQHVHAAESYFRYASEKEKAQLAHRIMMKAKKFGVNIESSTVKEWAKKYKN